MTTLICTTGGVFAAINISKGCIFGQLEERKPKKDASAVDMMCEGANRRHWIPKIKVASAEEESNVVSFNFDKKTYYRNFKSVEAGSQLLLCDESQLSERLGLLSTCYKKAFGFSCPFCTNSYLVFRHLYPHMERCSGKAPIVIQDEADADIGQSTDDHGINSNDFEAFDHYFLSGLDGHQAKIGLAEMHDLVQINYGCEIKYDQSEISNNILQTAKASYHRLATEDIDLDESNNHNATEGGPIPDESSVHGTDTAIAQNGYYVNDARWPRSATEKSDTPAEAITVDAEDDATCIDEQQNDDITMMMNPGHAQCLNEQNNIQRRYPCTQCNRSFSMQPNLSSHMQCHATESVICRNCKVRCDNIKLFVLRRCCDDPQMGLVCSDCGLILSSSACLQEHLRTHTGEKPFACRHCGMLFRQHSGRCQHVQRHHAAKKSFICIHCGKSLGSHQSLTLHERSHTSEKLNSCRYCEKTFLRRSRLKQHERTHTGEKPYACEQCGRRFALRHYVTIHMRTHTGEKPYSCSYCEKTFARRNGLYQHKIVHLRWSTHGPSPVI